MPFFVLSPLPPGQTGTLAQYTRRPLTKSHFFGARTGSRKIPALITLAGVRFQYPHRNVTWPPVVCQRGRPPVKEVCPQNKPCRNTTAFHLGPPGRPCRQFAGRPYPNVNCFVSVFGRAVLSASFCRKTVKFFCLAALPAPFFRTTVGKTVVFLISIFAVSRKLS